MTQQRSTKLWRGKKRQKPKRKTKHEAAFQRAYRKGFMDGRNAEAIGSYRDD